MIHNTMKYGRLWKDKFSTIHDDLKDTCINYKSWKKRMKTHQFCLKELQIELFDKNKLFITRTKMLLKPNNCMFRFCLNKNPSYQVRDLIEVANMNATSLSKLCKKVDKKTHNVIAKQWLCKIKSLHNVHFFNGLILSRLMFHTNDTSIVFDECPICFTDCSEKTPFLISRCGHYVCIQCLLQMFNSARIKGTLQNILLYNEYHNGVRLCCPICRYPEAYKHITKLNVVPSTCVHVLGNVQ